MRRVGPGVYYDAKKDSIHLLADELLVASGYLPTPENLEKVRVAAREVFGEAFPGAAISEEGFER